MESKKHRFLFMTSRWFPLYFQKTNMKAEESKTNQFFVKNAESSSQNFLAICFLKNGESSSKLVFWI